LYKRSAAYENEFMINGFDFDSGYDEICTVSENGTIGFISLRQEYFSEMSTLVLLFFFLNLFSINIHN
jgi:hypothetical protein